MLCGCFDFLSTVLLSVRIMRIFLRNIQHPHDSVDRRPYVMRHMGEKFCLCLVRMFRFIYGNLQLFILILQHLIGLPLQSGNDTAEGGKQCKRDAKNNEQIPGLIQIIDKSVIHIRNIHVKINDIVLLILRYRSQRFIHHINHDGICRRQSRQRCIRLVAVIIPFNQIGIPLVFRLVVKFYCVHQRNIRFFRL